MGRKTHNTAGATRFDDFKRTPEAFPERTKPVERTPKGGAFHRFFCLYGRGQRSQSSVPPMSLYLLSKGMAWSASF